MGSQFAKDTTVETAAAQNPAAAALFQPILCANCGSESARHTTLIDTVVTHPGHLNGQPLRVVICSQCGLTFLNPQPTAASLKRFYEREYYSDKKEAVDPQKRVKEKLWQRDILLTWLMEQLPPVRNWSILDIGCGYGEWLQHFDKSNRLLGIEQSESAAHSANKDFGVDVRQIDFMENGYAPETFELVTGLAIIEHVLDPLAALVEVNRITKPGGYAYLQTPDLRGLVLRKGIARFFKVVHTYYYTEATLASLFRKAGFEIVASRRRPAVLSTSDLLRPGNFWAGELDILARKKSNVTLAEARAVPWTGDQAAETIAIVEAAKQRDLGYAKWQDFYKIPVVGKLANHVVRFGFRVTGRNTKRVNFHTRQLEMLKAAKDGVGRQVS